MPLLAATEIACGQRACVVSSMNYMLAMLCVLCLLTLLTLFAPRCIPHLDRKPAGASFASHALPQRPTPSEPTRIHPNQGRSKQKSFSPPQRPSRRGKLSSFGAFFPSASTSIRPVPAQSGQFRPHGASRLAPLNSEKVVIRTVPPATPAFILATLPYHPAKQGSCFYCQ
jgi:hypothetical protein